MKLSERMREKISWDAPITDEQVEDWATEASQLESTNAKLLEACQEAHNYFLVLHEITQPEGMPEMVRILDEAIRKAKGE